MIDRAVLERTMVTRMRGVLVADGVRITPAIDRLLALTARCRLDVGKTDSLDHAWWTYTRVDTSKGSMSPRQVVNDPVLIREMIAGMEAALRAEKVGA